MHPETHRPRRSFSLQLHEIFYHKCKLEDVNETVLAMWSYIQNAHLELEEQYHGAAQIA